ncbi:putative transposase [Klebsiella quasipneumoniae]|nr:putative transposase [Klebsiella quasipneumoniae]
MDVDWLIAERPGKVKTLKQHPRKNKTAINIEYMKASIRARVEHHSPWPTCFGWTK